jgi:hypothetical protein
LLGSPKDGNGNLIGNPDLHSMIFGAGNAGDANTLYLTAALAGGTNGDSRGHGNRIDCGVLQFPSGICLSRRAARGTRLAQTPKASQSLKRATDKRRRTASSESL